MSEHEKKRTNEENMRKNLSGDLLKNALEFVEHMNKTSGWNHMGEPICYIITNLVTKYGSFFIFFSAESIVCNSDFNNYPISDELKNFVFKRINHCTRCSINTCGENAELNLTILGEKFYDLCHAPICFADPDTETFGKIKELVEAWKLCIEAVKQAAV